MNASQLKTYAVWDLGTRSFHWINVLCVLGLFGVGLIILMGGDLGISNDGKVALKTLHVYIGYVFALNLAWRFVWAFIGNRHARWRAILPGGAGYGRALRAYASAFFFGSPRAYLGHNPMGRISVALLMLMLLVQAVTGLLLAGTDIFFPPFGGLIADWVAAPGVDPATLVPYAPDMVDKAAYADMRAFRSPFITVHKYNFYALIAAVVLHVAAVVITEAREGGGIVSAMLNGRKTLAGPPADEGDPGER